MSEFYTLRQLEDGLIGARSWNAWRDNIKAMTNNPTDRLLKLIFTPP